MQHDPLGLGRVLFEKRAEVVELRTQPAGHPSYRRTCQEMHRLIRDQAGHANIAALIRFTNHEETTEGRLAAETRTERRRAARGLAPPTT